MKGEPVCGTDAVAQRDALVRNIALGVTALVLLLTVRAFSGRPASLSNGRRSPGMPGYWLPYLGHAPQVLVNASGLLASARRQFTEGVFSLYLMGETHNILYKPSLVESFLGSKSTIGDGSWLSQRLLRVVFGMSRKDLDIYNRLRPELESLNRTHLRDESVDPVLKQLRNQVADLVTFNSYPADQMEWERMADADAIKCENDESAMQVDLVELIKHFVARTSSIGLFGTDFVENFPEFWQMLWIVDKGFVPLALNVPGWLPWPSAQRARTARRKLVSSAYEFHASLDKYFEGVDNEPRWQDLDNVGSLVLARAKLFREHGMSLEGRAVCDVALAWDMNAKTCMLISWMLTELYRDSVFLAEIREEIVPFLKVSQPKNDFGLAVWVPPEIEKVDVNGLANSCPLLRSAYLETLRLYSTDVVSRWMSEDVIVKDGENKDEAHLLKKGTYVHVPAEVHHLDPGQFQDPYDWRATRHLHDAGDSKGSKKIVDEESIRKYGKISTTMCVLIQANSLVLGDGVTVSKPEPLQLREVLLYTATLISLYDVEPPKGQHWKIPGTTRSGAGQRPSRPVKVWIRRRNLAAS